MPTPERLWNRAKQFHDYKGIVDIGPTTPVMLGEVPAHAFIFAAYASRDPSSESSIFKLNNLSNSLSIGSASDPEAYAKKMSFGEDNVVQMPLGPRAGYCPTTRVLYAYYHFSGRGAVTINPCIVVQFCQ